MGTDTDFTVQPSLSAVLIEARSSVGPIDFGTTELEGSVTARIVDGGWAGDATPQAAVHVDMRSLTSGNTLYDAELARRIDSLRFPTATIALRDLLRIGSTHRYHATGGLTLHGVTRELTGTVVVSSAESGAMLIDGEHVVDVREFNIPVPTALMLRIYPDVRVHLHLHLTRGAAGHSGDYIDRILR